MHAKLTDFKTFIIEFWQYGVFPLRQVHSATVFFKISVRRTKCWLKISIARERLNILDFQFYSFISKVSEVYSKLTAPLRFSPQVENKYFYQPEQTNNY